VRAVLDPNVLVSALLSRRGTPAQIVRLWLEGAFELVASPLLVSELERVLEYPKISRRIANADAAAFVTLLSAEAAIAHDPPGPPTLTSRDPQDDYLIALAQAARAFVVSGDRHLLEMSGTIPVYGPAEFLKLLSEGQGARL
jgi:putative PIN family toxin of toxin-antitoxin system